ncbi:P-loop containing nucleoside triphosphate hydrolase [Syntrophomonas zehnderi OL-4]|uniref:p-loop containing nucleoside triphosphate hydrolase n=1 Tax=Syntrophomonas zehnderi OL-4 TaxID=690567 RepID=A0A0E4G9D8_9FIRM|nr:AAA family ATPase [Syntrophomonas zehnderi]CFX12712.1 P-loop containing nucleoside triphosphate hydrolase [Syntrophomonas zehnderi OL-4]
MPTVISLINLKGGVGKTTLTVAMAEFMAAEHGLRVLVVDLDPQTNATVSLIHEQEWRRRNMRGQTVLNVFLDHLSKYRIFSPQEAIIRKVSNIQGGIEGLDLLPSSIDLIEVHDEFLRASAALPVNPLHILGGALRESLPDYDIVLIDCPPDLGLICQNGLMISNYYIIPTIPDILSTYGIPQIVNRIERLKSETGIPIQPLGLVISKFREQSNTHKAQTPLLRLNAHRDGYQRVLETVIPEGTRAAAVMDSTLNFTSLHDKYGYDNPYRHYQSLTEEVLSYVRK